MKRLILSLGLLVVAGLVLHAAEQANELARTQQVSLSNQTGAISAMTVVTPSVNTGFMVTGHTSVHGTNGGNTMVTPIVTYTDTQGFSHFALNTLVTSDQATDGIAFIYAKGGTSITFSSSYSGGTDNASYDVVFSFYQQP